MSWIWTMLILASIVCAFVVGTGSELAAAAMEGAQSGVTLAISVTGALCLWSGVGRLMEAGGITAILSRLMMPLIGRIFPEARFDPGLSGDLSANICANLLGLGNAATPPGISAAKRLSPRGLATDSLCRLIVLNTASIQLIPTNVAAIRSALGCASPFDLLPAVWLTSFCSAGMGLSAAWILGKVYRHD